jgi:hypothetical protein
VFVLLEEVVYVLLVTYYSEHQSMHSNMMAWVVHCGVPSIYGTDTGSVSTCIAAYVNVAGIEKAMEETVRGR